MNSISSRIFQTIATAAITTLLSAGAVPALGAPGHGAPGSQSVTGSRAASEMLGEGSVLIASGTAELLSTGGSLVVTSVERSARGVQLVLQPVADAVSATAEVSAAVTVEISLEAWELATSAARAAGRGATTSAAVVGDLVETMAVSTSIVGSAAGTSVIGTALVIGRVVIGIVPDAALAEMLGHGVHRCEHS